MPNNGEDSSDYSNLGIDEKLQQILKLQEMLGKERLKRTTLQKDYEAVVDKIGNHEDEMIKLKGINETL